MHGAGEMSVVDAAALAVPPLSAATAAATPTTTPMPPHQQRTAAAAAKSAALDLAAGTAAGTAQLLVGHPFDTVKVKVQSSARYSGPLDAARQTLRAEGVRGLYRGMAAPLATVALFNAVLFTARGQAAYALQQRRRQQQQQQQGESGGDDAGSAPAAAATLGDELAAALAASAAVSLVATPTELLKCRLQAQGGAAVAAARLQASTSGSSSSGTANPAAAAAATTAYRGPADVARHVLRHEGGARGLFKGLNATLTREALGNLAMFGVYHAVKDALSERRGIPASRLPFGDLLLAGGLGGVAFWLCCYPADIVKSKLQLDSYARPQYKGMLDCARQLVACGGGGALWRGFGPALARSFPANAVCFATYEGVSGLLRGGGGGDDDGSGSGSA